MRGLRRFGPGLLLLLPTLGLLGVFRFFPLLSAAENSFYDTNLISGQRQFLGLDNFERMLKDSVFHRSLVNTIGYTALKVPLEVTLGLGLALLTNQAIRGISLLRAAIFLPVITSLVVAATMWKMLLDPNQGLINGLLSTIGIPRQPFLGDVGQAFYSVIGVMVWKDVGLVMIFFLAGLQAIPKEYYEAAKVDGASRWAQFSHITLPLLRGTLLFVLVIEIAFAFRIFESIYVMTQGGPERSTTMAVFYIYEQAFPFNSIGYASAMSLALLAIVIGTTIVLRRVTGGTVEH